MEGQGMAQAVVVNQYKDFLERVGWTALQAAAGFLLDDLINGHVVIWQSVAIAAGIAALKVLTAQRLGHSNDGAAIPGGVIKTVK
jgi:hypothetical protein